MDFPSNVHVMDHPLIRHKIAHLRSVDTDTKHFREIVKEIASLMCYEALRSLPTETVDVRTPFETVKQEVVADDSVALVPILRAGLGMVDGVLNMLPIAKVGHLGMYRDEETHMPVEYYCKLPSGIEGMDVVILDPMLATGGSACDAIDVLKRRGCRNIRAMFIIASPEGVMKVSGEHPDVEIYIATVDRGLNEDCYILPGLGDAGDRIFGTFKVQ